jgi:hypothetical protein
VPGPGRPSVLPVGGKLTAEPVVRPYRAADDQPARRLLSAAFGRESVADLSGELRASDAHRAALVGSALVRAAVDAAGRLGAPLLFLEGSPRYYSRFGFSPGAEHGFRRPSERIPDAAFQVLLFSNWQDWMVGALVYPDVFWRHDAVGLRGDRLARTLDELG